MKLKVFAVFLLSLVSLSWADEPSADLGKDVYKMQCARCHGPEGKGDGPDAKRLTVAPRDLTSGRFKFKTTVQGTPPSDDDLITGIISHGVTGSGMPSFANLETETKKNLVAYIKTISPAFADNAQPEPIKLPSNARSKVDLKKGEEVFNKLQCALCHGPAGRADGTSAFTLVDAWGKPIKPTNLAQGWTYGGGHRPEDVYYRIVAGIDGAPMPSYEGAATHEEMWNLSTYVASLQIPTNWSGEILGQKTKTSLPTSADDKAWDKAERTDVHLSDYFYEAGHRSDLTVKAVSVQAVYNKDSVAFRIFWDDPVKNERGNPDQLLIAFQPKDFSGEPRSSLYNLYEPNSPALNVMFWQASEPAVVKQKKSNLYLTGRYGWVADKTYSVSDLSYDKGRWTMVFTCPLPETGEMTPIAFAAWDGANGETLNKRAASSWVQLVLGEKKSHH